MSFEYRWKIVIAVEWSCSKWTYIKRIREVHWITVAQRSPGIEEEVTIMK